MTTLLQKLQFMLLISESLLHSFHLSIDFLHLSVGIRYLLIRFKELRLKHLNFLCRALTRFCNLLLKLILLSSIELGLFFIEVKLL